MGLAARLAPRVGGGVLLTAGLAVLGCGSVALNASAAYLATHSTGDVGHAAFVPEVWGKAVNAETKLLLLTHAFEQLNVGRSNW